MKKNIIKQFGLMLLVLFAMLASNTSLLAQTDEETNDDEESGFFNDGLESNRFESNYGDKSGTQHPTYEYKSRSNDNELNKSVEPAKNLDMEVRRGVSSDGIIVIGSGGTGAGVSENNKPSSNSTNGITVTGPTPKIKNVDPNIPDNPGDPDAPIDGGVLVALGIGYGVWRKKREARK